MLETKRTTALLLAIVLCVSLCGCAVSKEEVMGIVAPTEAPDVGPGVVHVEVEVEEELPPEQLICEAILGCFNPFWAKADGDAAVVKATQLALLGEESGYPITVTSETAEDNRSAVTISVKPGTRFSDGTEITADDLLFTYYALLDIDYTGPIALGELPVVGLQEYRTGIPADLYEKYGEKYDEIYDEGRYDQKLQDALEEAENLDPKNSYEVKKAQKALDAYDSESAELIRESITDAWRNDAKELTDYYYENFRSTVEYHTGYTYDQLTENEGLRVMFAMVESDVATLATTGALVATKSGDVWDLRTQFPTNEDFYNELAANYDNDPYYYWQIMGIGRYDMFAFARDGIIAKWAAEDAKWTEGVNHISGIERENDYAIRILLEYAEPGSVAALCDAFVAPMHYYGNTALFDPENGSFGFTKGDLTGLRKHDGEPLGAGEYVYMDYSDGFVHLTANSKYFGRGPENPRMNITTAVYAG